jgi:quercetin dioxygenase-like cupin family protein
MRLTRSREVPLVPMEAANFSGTAQRRDLGATAAPDCRSLVVRFEPGARTHWHRHRDGQLIYALEGRGSVGTRDGDRVEIGPGDLVYAPPNEVHWHGAVADSALTHLALSFGATEWLDAVDALGDGPPRARP